MLRGAGARECVPHDKLRDEAIHTFTAARRIASLALAMTEMGCLKTESEMSGLLGAARAWWKTTALVATMT
jgi:hypothetical protein